MRSPFASARHVDGSGPCAAWSASPAASTAAQSACEHASRSPPPQYLREKAPRGGGPATSRRSLSTYPYQPPPYELPPAFGESSGAISRASSADVAAPIAESKIACCRDAPPAATPMPSATTSAT